MSAPSKTPPKGSVLRRIAAALGPGVITGAADDDPSGIATYSITGAQFGTKFLWTAPVLWPLMAAVQMMCARIGLVTGQGLAGALRQKYPRWLLATAAGALFIANTLFSNVAMFFIIVTTASTLHAHGQAQLATSADVAAALRPLAGRFAMLLYTIGIVGTGLLAIPTLAGSAAYAFAETFNWRQGIDERFTRARAFYAVIGVSIAIGVAMDFVGISAVKALYWTAVINGLLAPFLMVGILHAASDRKLMRGQPSSWLGRVVVGVTTVAMFAAGIAMFVV